MSKERESVPLHEHEPTSYTLAARYPTDESSQVPYNEAQNLIFTNTKELDLSAYRFQLRRLEPVQVDWYVALVGIQPPAEFDARFRRILIQGEEVQLPQEVHDALIARRAEVTKLAPWVEGHYSYNKRRRQR
jgi:hypothetical protein